MHVRNASQTPSGQVMVVVAFALADFVAARDDANGCSPMCASRSPVRRNVLSR